LKIANIFAKLVLN